MNNSMKENIIGMRTLKTAISLGVCMLVYILFKLVDTKIIINGVSLYKKSKGFRFSDFYSPFFAGIAAAYSTYPSRKQSIAQAKNRVVASLLGGLIGMTITIGFGLIGYISGNDFFTWPNLGDNYKVSQYVLPYIINFFGIILVVIVGNLIGKKPAIFVGILTYISVTINPMGMIVSRYNKVAPFLGEAVFGTNRILSTLVGVSIALIVNFIELPHKNKNNDLLFVIGIEGMLNNDYDTVKGYINYKVNKISDDGINTTIYTTRIPSTFMHLIENINLKHPVVCMSGAALYDTNKLKYVGTEVIDKSLSVKIDTILNELGVTPFKNYIRDDLLYTYIEKIDNDAEMAYYDAKKNERYSNMILGTNNNDEDILHYFLCENEKTVDSIISMFKEAGIYDELEVQVYDTFMPNQMASDIKYLKIYSKKVRELNLLKNYCKENNLKIVGLTTSTMADYLLENSYMKFSCSDTLVEGATKKTTYNKLFKEITKTYYRKDLK